MKYLNVFDNKSALDSSVTSINHGKGAFVFGVTTTYGIEDVTNMIRDILVQIVRN